VAIDEKIKKIEALTKEIEGDKSFDNAIKKFTEAAELIKAALKESALEKGKVTEIIKDLDEYIEKEFKAEAD
jgi:exonuclease VII small subunit